MKNKGIKSSERKTRKSKKQHIYRKFYRKIGKRIFDFCFASMALLFLAPLIMVIALLVRFQLGSPIFFKQKRPKKNEKIFNMYKFRSMTNQCDTSGNLLPDEERLTAFGKWLRASSLDELPELFNVIKGDMSLVGPRPLLVKYLPLYSKKQRKRHLVKPGITGWAQVNGRNAISWEEKFELDLWYVKNMSFQLDLKILLQTVKTVLKREGIKSETSETMEEFQGSGTEWNRL